MPGIQEISRRIKSTKSTRKVTRAMQMVSASKMRKAQNATMASRSYADLAWELIQSLGSVIPDKSSPPAGGETRSGIQDSDTDYNKESAYVSGSEISAKPDSGMTQLQSLLHPSSIATKVAVIIISTNRGLVGSFNANLFAKLKHLAQEYGADNVDYITMGRKASDIAVRLRKPIIADFTKYDTIPTSEQVLPLAGMVAKEFAVGTYQAVYVVYNHFISTLSQEVRVKQLLPFTREAQSKSTHETNLPMVTNIEYEFEPDAQTVLSHLLPRILESQLYQAVLESDASEHSARMIMMKNATDSAGDLIADLTLTFNQLRQNKITTELSEITAGKIALEK